MAAPGPLRIENGDRLTADGRDRRLGGAQEGHVRLGHGPLIGGVSLGGLALNLRERAQPLGILSVGCSIHRRLTPR